MWDQVNIPSLVLASKHFIDNLLLVLLPANITLCRSYLSDSTRLAERTAAVSMVSLAQVLGFIVGPALQAIVTPLGEHGLASLPGLNMFTAAGWLNVFMAIGNFCLFLPIFFEVRPTTHRLVTRSLQFFFPPSGTTNSRKRGDEATGKTNGKGDVEGNQTRLLFVLDANCSVFRASLQLCVTRNVSVIIRSHLVL